MTRAQRIIASSGLVAAAIVIAVALFGGWLLNTVGGRNLLLGRIVASLPADAHLTWRSADGPASGPLTLHDLHFDYHGTIFDAKTVTLDPAFRPLVRGRLRLDALLIAHGVLQIPESTDPFQLPEWPDSLPMIATPLPINAVEVTVDDLRVDYGGKPAVQIATVRGGVQAEPGLLRLHGLRLDSDRGRFTFNGHYAPGDDYRTGITANALLPATADGTRAHFGLSLRGSLAHMEFALAGRAPGPVSARVSLRGKQAQNWNASVSADGVDGAALGVTAPGGLPWAAKLAATGAGGQSQWQGDLRQGDLHLAMLPSRIGIARQKLVFQPLVLGVADGEARITGSADFGDPKAIKLQLGVGANGFRLSGATPAEAIVGGGDITLKGTSSAWTVVGKATLHRGAQSATVDLDVSGDTAQAQVKSLHAAMPTGTLDADGRVAWSPALSWTMDARLAGFDPGYFFPGWDGAIHGAAHSDGTRRADGGLEASLDAPALSGTLRGRALAANAKLRMHGEDAYDGTLSLRLGASKVEASGTIAGSVDVSATFSPLQLQDLLPSGHGILRGHVQVSGPRRAPDIAAELEGNDLAWDTRKVAHLSAHGHLPWHAGARGQLHVDARGLDVGVPFTALVLDARGAIEQLTLQARATGDIGVLAFGGDATRAGEGWRGHLATLDFEPTRGTAWRLQQPSAFAWTGTRGSVERACLANSGGGTLCAGGEWPGAGIRVRGSDLPLSLVQAYLPEQSDGQSWRMHGNVNLDATLQPGAGGAWSGRAKVLAGAGGFALGGRQDALGFQRVELDARFDANKIGSTLKALFTGGGTLDARVDTGWAPAAALDATAELHTSELTWLELFSPDIAAPTGRVDGTITLTGSRASARLGGSAVLSNFGADVPALGTTLREGNLRLEPNGNSEAKLTGQVRSGDGVLHVAGTVGWGGDGTPVNLHVSGKNVLAADMRTLRAVIDPELDVVHRVGEGISVTGIVGVPSARLHLERLGGGVASSPDVRIVDPAQADQGAPMSITMDLTIVPGNDVRVDGYGLDGRLTGRLRALARPGREMIASGALDIDGKYLAYGQKLDITRGKLVWSNSPIANPLLDIRAERQVGDVTAGVDVRGRAEAPTATVWSNPASSQSEALAYLALGRPLSSASAAEGQQLNAARSALSLGSNLLVGQLGAKLGLEDAGISENRALGGSVVSAGKYLSPKLYVSYGVALVGSGQVLTLKYLLRKGFDIEIASSSVENKASVNYRKER